MSVTNPISQMAMISKLSISQIQEKIRNGTLDPIIAQPILRQKIMMAEAKKRQDAMQQPQQPPVTQQNMAYADPGITAAPVAMEMAQGGIVAFAEGGESTEAYNRASKESFFGKGLEAIAPAAEFAATYAPTLPNLVKTAGGYFIDKLTGMRWVRNPYTGELTRASNVVESPNAGKLADMGPMAQRTTAPAIDSEKPTGSIANLLPANLAQAGAPAAPSPAVDLIGTSNAGGYTQRSGGKGINAAAKGYEVGKFDDSVLKDMLAGENNPATGKPYTYEEIAARNKQRAIDAGIDPDIYDKQQKELESKKERPESRRKLDEAMPWFALSEALGKAQAGEGIGTTIGRGLSAYGRTSSEISDKEEARLEGIRKEGNQLALAQNAFRQAEMVGNKADMKIAQDRIDAARLKMSDLGVESTKAQNDYAKTMAELQNRREIAAMQESGAWGRAGMERNQVTQLANMYLKEAAAKGQPMTQAEAMEKAYYTTKFQGTGLATEARTEKSKQDAYQSYRDEFAKNPLNLNKQPLPYQQWLATSAYNTGAGGASPNVVDFNSLPK